MNNTDLANKPEEKMSKDEYFKKKDQIHTNFMGSLVTVIFFVFFFAVVLAIVVVFGAIEDPDNIAGILFWGTISVILFVIGGKILCAELKQRKKGLTELMMDFERSGDSEDVKSVKREAVRKRVTAIIVIVALIMTPIVFVTIDHMDKVNTYQTAEHYIIYREFEKAREMLETLESDYEDTSNMITLCDACISYKEGNIVGAYSDINDVVIGEYEHHPQYKSVYDGMRKVISNAHVDYIHEKLRKEEEEKKRFKKELKESGVPYVGMDEKDMGETSLGEPFEIPRKAIVKYKDGTTKNGYFYDYYTGEGENRRRIFEICVCEDKVVDVEDYRNKTAPYVFHDPGFYISSGSYGSSSSSDDPYDVDRYSNEEDFYDDNYHNFIDYYAAEKYYKEHKQ